jgi:hypothetical protein
MSSCRDSYGTTFPDIMSVLCGSRGGQGSVMAI